MPMWWRDLREINSLLRVASSLVHATVKMADDVQLIGAVSIGAGSRICSGVTIEGPVVVGAGCVIGSGTRISGASWIGQGCRVGARTLVAHAHVGDRSTLGNRCVVAHSWLEEDVMLGPEVVTRCLPPDGRSVQVLREGRYRSTGQLRLGCRIGADTSLGSRTIVLPGTDVPGSSLFGPNLTLSGSFAPGRYQHAGLLRGW